MNPILRKELRSLLRERRGWLVPGIYGALLSGMVYLSGVRTDGFVDPTSFGSSSAGMVAGMQALAVSLIAPILGAAAISSERERGTWTRLLGAPIARWQIAAGKVGATVVYVVLMLLVSLPVASLAVLFGGMDLATLTGLYAAHLFLGVALGCLGLAISTAFHRTWVASVVALAAAAALVALGGLSPLAFTFAPGERSASVDVLRSVSPTFGTELFFTGDQLEDCRRLWAMHFGALLSIAAASIAFVLARVRSMVD